MVNTVKYISGIVAIIIVFAFVIFHRQAVAPIVTPVLTASNSPSRTSLPIIPTSSSPTKNLLPVPKATPTKTITPPSAQPSMTPLPTATPIPTSSVTPTPMLTATPTPSLTPTPAPAPKPTISSLVPTTISYAAHPLIQITGANLIINGVVQVKAVKIGTWSMPGFGVPDDHTVTTSMQVNSIGTFDVSIVALDESTSVLTRALTVNP